jgi:NitT/TauT family transport system permease protein
MRKKLTDPLITFAVLLAVWVAALGWFRIPNYILPTPAEVLWALKLGYIDGLYWPHFFATLQATALGYLLGGGIAFALGALAAESTAFDRFIYPYVVGLQSMPKVALAPLIIVWFGFGLASKVVTVALICFFPLFINTVVGIRQTDPALVDLLKVFSASRTHIFFEVKLPAAAGHIFAGLEISVVLSLIGAIVSEFVASQRGLGNLIQASSQNLDVAATVAVLFSLAVIGVSGSLLVRYLHSRLVFWERRRADATAVTEQA